MSTLGLSGSAHFLRDVLPLLSAIRCLQSVRHLIVRNRLQLNTTSTNETPPQYVATSIIRDLILNAETLDRLTLEGFDYQLSDTNARDLDVGMHIPSRSSDLGGATAFDRIRNVLDEREMALGVRINLDRDMLFGNSDLLIT